MRQVLKISLVWAMVGFAVAALAANEPRFMTDELFTMLTKGYKEMSQSKFNEAQAEFEKVIRVDFDNPFANNNLAVLMEKQGRLQDAMTYLNIAEKMAGQYLYKVETLYLIGGVCAAVNPEKVPMENSGIAQVIADNKKKLEEKLAPKTSETPRNAGK